MAYNLSEYRRNYLTDLLRLPKGLSDADILNAALASDSVHIINLLEVERGPEIAPGRSRLPQFVTTPYERPELNDPPPPDLYW